MPCGWRAVNCNALPGSSPPAPPVDSPTWQACGSAASAWRISGSDGCPAIRGAIARFGWGAGRPRIPAVNPALRSANLGLCARLRARIARAKVLNACSGARCVSGVTRAVYVGAFDVQLKVERRPPATDWLLQIGFDWHWP